VDQPALTESVETKMQKGEALRWTSSGIMMDPIRGAYPQNVWARDWLSGGGYFAIGFSGLREEQKQAWLWFYNHNLKDCDETIGAPYDTISPYPHVSVCSFVNWPFELEERNPAEVLPLCYIDSTGFMAWRNRWQDLDDTLISVAVAMTKGYHRKSADKALYVTARNPRRALEWGKIASSKVVHWWKTDKGEMSVFTLGDGSSFAVDFSGRSGTDVMLVTTSKVKGKNKPIKIGSKNVSFLFPTVDEGPEPVLNGDVIVIGEQQIGLDGDDLVVKE
jgi:hypothetical protein